MPQRLDGRYRDVNVCGAAMIAMIQEKLATRNFPFVFGGDGATVLLPHSVFTDLEADFKRLILKIQRDFKLELRVGWVRYGELKKKGATIQVARLKISPTNYLATLKGAGVALAEKLIKSDAKYLLSSDPNAGELVLSKLSCRFLPIRTKKDVVLSLLAAPANEGKFSDFVEFLSGFRAYILDPNFKPIDGNLQMDSLWAVFSNERKVDPRSFMSVLFKIGFLKLAVLISVLFKQGKIANTVRTYYDEIPLNSDYQKFDGVLRMVIDCTNAEKAEILKVLEHFRMKNVIQYGTSESPFALMTCIVDDIHGGEHIHFIDGGNGGYTLAAKAMKKAMG